MAGNGYSGRGYSNYNTPQAKDWRRTSYASDRANRPVIIDAEGRKREIISCTPTENLETYVIKAERLVQQVHSSVSSNYKYGARPVSDQVEDYVVVVDPYGPGKRWNQPNDRPEKVEEFLNEVQTEASRPRWPLNASHWHTPTGNTDGYGEFNDQTNKEWNTPFGNPHRNEKSQNNPAMVTSGERTWPSQSPWATPPEASLSKPTNDINTAMRVLQEAARTSPAPKPRSFEQAYAETIDSKEAARRYGNYNFGPRPYAAEDNYTTTIDSREAARKYRGTTV